MTPRLVHSSNIINDILLIYQKKNNNNNKNWVPPPKISHLNTFIMRTHSNSRDTNLIHIADASHLLLANAYLFNNFFVRTYKYF